MHGRPDFASAYDEHVAQVFGFFAYRVAGREQAEDLTQITFEKALRAWGRYDPGRSRTHTWLLAIARNVLVDHYRADRSATHVALDDVPESVLGIHPDAAGRADLDGPLRAALSELGRRDREIVALRFGADLTGPEIAALTGLTLANVQQVLSRSLRRLRARLESDGQGAEREQRHA